VLAALDIARAGAGAAQVLGLVEAGLDRDLAREHAAADLARVLVAATRLATALRVDLGTLYAATVREVLGAVE
jgi:hypothetical protein